MDKAFVLFTAFTFLTAWAISACVTEKPVLQAFILNEGDAIGCKAYKMERCGMHLIECGDNKIDLICVTNVTFEGPTFIVEKVSDK